MRDNNPARPGRKLRWLIVAYLALATVAVLFTRVLWRSVPFDLASYAAWAGILLALLALVSLAKPQRWLGIPTRSRAAICLGFGGAMTCTALAWPARVHHRSTDGPGPLPLDAYLPDYQSVEYHEARTRASLASVRAAARQVSLADMPGARLLMGLRNLASGRLESASTETPLLDVMTGPGSPFIILDTRPEGIVLGMVGRPWAADRSPHVNSPDEFRAFSSAGHVRVVFDLRAAQDGAGEVRLSTETRILGNDVEARRLFAGYWRLIYPGSAIIRRVWLDAIIARAERAP